MHYFIYTLDLKKKHSFELHRSTYMQIFFNTCVNLFFLPYDSLSHLKSITCLFVQKNLKNTDQPKKKWDSSKIPTINLLVYVLSFQSFCYAYRLCTIFNGITVYILL